MNLHDLLCTLTRLDDRNAAICFSAARGDEITEYQSLDPDPFASCAEWGRRGCLNCAHRFMIVVTTDGGFGLRSGL